MINHSISHQLKVLLDHNTIAGFEAIAQAREYLLDMGRKESADVEAVEWPIRGSHVVAPVSNEPPPPVHVLVA